MGPCASGRSLLPRLAGAAALGAGATLLVSALAATLAGRGPAPTRTRTLLLTGFGPFGPHATNPSWEVARALDGERVGGTLVRSTRLDVAWARAGEQLRDACRAVRPDLALSLGVAAGHELRLEVVARNRDSSREPDVDGVVRDPGCPVRQGGPPLLPTRLPVGALYERLLAAGFAEVAVTDDAGGYLCNHVFYRLLDEVPHVGTAGFVHVPTLGGTWTAERLRAAIRLVVQVLDEFPPVAER